MNGAEQVCDGLIVGMMATFPARAETLGQVVNSIAEQLDILYVYLNDYETVPDILCSQPNIRPLLSSDYDGDLSATGKIFPLQFCRNCLVFTLDDDIVYPADYVSRMAGLLAKLEYDAAVTVHGSIFDADAQWYFERTRVFPFKRKLAEHRFVALPGSGTFAFHQSSLPIRYQDFSREPMVDLQFAISCRRHVLPIVAIARKQGWLNFLGYTGLYETYLTTSTHHTESMQQTAPWTFDVFRSLCKKAIENYYANDEGGGETGVLLDRGVELALHENVVPAAWCRSLATLKKRSQFMELLANQKITENNP